MINNYKLNEAFKIDEEFVVYGPALVKLYKDISKRREARLKSCASLCMPEWMVHHIQKRGFKADEQILEEMANKGKHIIDPYNNVEYFYRENKQVGEAFYPLTFKIV